MIADPAAQAWHRVARQLGCTVSEARRRMRATEFRRWLANEAIDPSGENRADYRIAVLCSVVAHIAGAELSPLDVLRQFFDYAGEYAPKPDRAAAASKLERWLKSTVKRETRKRGA